MNGRVTDEPTWEHRAGAVIGHQRLHGPRLDLNCHLTSAYCRPVLQSTLLAFWAHISLSPPQLGRPKIRFICREPTEDVAPRFMDPKRHGVIMWQDRGVVLTAMQTLLRK